ncbi:hypothetical protein D3C78_1914460 [compost metagenome]
MHIPAEMLDEEMAMEVISIAPSTLTMFPESLYTPRLIEMACSSYPAILPLIPDQHLTPAQLEAKARFIEMELERRRQRDDQ